MKLYRVYFNDAEGQDTGNFDFDLRTAKALKQVEADRQRLLEHRKQVPLKWERFHSNKKILWRGYIGNQEYASLWPSDDIDAEDQFPISVPNKNDVASFFLGGDEGMPTYLN